jgi:energy-converting hydrogenase Eha subunit C
MQCRLKKVSDYLLYASVGIATTIFIITFVVVIMGDKDSNGELKLSITLELMWAVIDTVVSLSLVGIGFFAVYKLTSVFGDHFNKEALFVSVISVVFCLGYLIHGIYDWVIYFKWKNGLMIS